ncbi:MAG: AAA family ATPase, partial [Treponema sp.]|nr:AAA family ATPase [Treponema sp.]
MEQIRKLPVGIQTFERIRSENYIYVDKTQFVFELANLSRPYFLSRPRRFGKSLLLSTFRSYFEGKKDLFHGLALEKLEENAAKEENREAWIEYPVLYVDFNTGDFSSFEKLEETLSFRLSEWEKEYDVHSEAKTIADRFSVVIEAACKKTGRQVVVLVDEYDKPLLNVVDNVSLLDQFRAILKSFYGILKSYDRYLRFVFLTGVTRFDKVSIFSDLNNLIDISMTEKYSAICGYTQKELETVFEPEIAQLAEKKKISHEECVVQLKKMYDGYHFTEDMLDIYNPFSTMSAFVNNNLGSYWFATGTPTFLVKMMQKTSFPLETLE